MTGGSISAEGRVDSLRRKGPVRRGMDHGEGLGELGEAINANGLAKKVVKS